MRATIREVSASAGVSVTTVSRVLNNEPYVRPETRRRVEAAVAALNFRPSIAARALAGQRAHQIALIYSNPSPYYVYSIQSGARAHCAERGYRVIFQECDIAAPGLLRDIAGLIDETHLDGLILSPPVSNVQAVLVELTRRRIPFVRIAPGADLACSSYVHMDDSAAAEEMTDHLVGLGHRDIGFVMGHVDHLASAQRFDGYCRALRKHGLPLDPARIIQGRFDFHSGHQAGVSLLSGRDRPTAIFASNDDMAAGVLAAAHEQGLSIPADIAIAGFDDTDLARVVWPSLTTIRQPTRELAYAAAQILIDGTTDMAALLPHKLIVRNSTRPAGPPAPVQSA